MKAYVNVFTSGLGYSSWILDLGFTILPKYIIKNQIRQSFNKWFRKGKNIYVYTKGSMKIDKSWIIKIGFI